jgi:hypothetical protein
MNGLRIFIRPDKSPIEDNVFYSQRGHGPIYRWQYDEQLAKWHVTRVDVFDSTSYGLCTARWQSVPKELKVQLSEHYVE